jgi:peptidyl-prolyl cis-trans isomerase SurA
MRLPALVLLALLPAAALAQAPARPAAPAAVASLDRVVAVVNNDVILQSELSQRVKTAEAQLRRQSTPIPAPNVLRRQVLERMIVDRLQLQVADKAGVRLDDEGLNAAMRRMAEQNKLTLPQFKQVLEKDGYDFNAFREQLRDELTISEIRRRQVENRVQVTDREIDNILVTAASQANADDEYRVAQILVAVREGASPGEVASARERAQDLLEELRKGADFAQLAAGRSEADRALEGGETGWRRVSQLPTAVADAVLRMKPGQVSEPVRDASGFHIVKLLDVRRAQRAVVTQQRVRHILIRVDQSRPEPATRARLQQLRTRIQGGEDFAELARAHSMDPTSASRGGDLGWLNPGDVVPELEQAVAALQPGQISEPFRTQFGIHIAQVTDRRQHDSTDEIRRTRAREFVRQRKIEEDTQAWIRRLRDEAYVEVRPEE